MDVLFYDFETAGMLKFGILKLIMLEGSQWNNNFIWVSSFYMRVILIRETRYRIIKEQMCKNIKHSVAMTKI